MTNIKTLLLVLMLGMAQSRKYDTCGLARELIYRHGASYQEAAWWVCIAYFESSYNTRAIGRRSGYGQYDHGLFQISERWWCGRWGQVPCWRLRDDNIADDLNLARGILHKQGPQAWIVYNQGKCNHYMQFLANC